MVTACNLKEDFLRVSKCDSMEPEFNEGEIVIVNPHVEAKSGDYVVVKDDEDEATFKQLRFAKSDCSDSLRITVVNGKVVKSESTRTEKEEEVLIYRKMKV